MKKVEIILSTYNGEKYLCEQIDSILNQTYPVHLTVRDDGSTDKTLELLYQYEKKYPEITVYRGKNVGILDSFYEGLKKARKADYYGFSDQDDIWEKDKVASAVACLEEMEKTVPSDGVKIPLLYACGQTLVDQNGKKIRTTRNSHHKVPSFGNALVENICAGCTELMNHTLKELVAAHRPEHTPMYDWWVYLLASYYGYVYFDQKAHILYRQHSDNSVGTKTTRWAEWSGRVKRYKKNRGQITRQLQSLEKVILEIEEHVVPEKRKADGFTNCRIVEDEKDRKQLLSEMLEGKENFFKRISLMRNHSIHRQRKVDDFIFRLILLSGSY